MFEVCEMGWLVWNDVQHGNSCSIQKQKRSFKEIASMFEFIVVYFPLLLIVVLGLGFAIWFLLTLRKKPDEDFEEDET